MPAAKKGEARCRDCAMRWEAKCPLCSLKIKKRSAVPELLLCPACNSPMIIQRFVRKALWRYAGKIYFCNTCYENWAKNSEFDPLQVERLSDDERDFDRVNLKVQLVCGRV
jgi:hypothetical protein